MSTPQVITCWTCGKTFVFLRGALEKCPNCGEEYMSHRDAGKKNDLKKEKKESKKEVK